jgi:hypothetical protein
MRNQIFPVAFALLLCLPTALVAQEQSHACAEREGSTDRPHVCEVREFTLAALPALQVDAGKNGGVLEMVNGGVSVQSR